MTRNSIEDLSEYCCGNGCDPCILDTPGIVGTMSYNDYLKQLKDPGEPNEVLIQLMNTSNEELYTNKKPSLIARAIDKLKYLWYTSY